MKYNYGNHEITPAVQICLIEMSRTTLHSLRSLEDAFKICGDIDLIEKADRLNVPVTTIVDAQNHLYRMYHPHEQADQFAKLQYSAMSSFEKLAARFFCRKRKIPLRDVVGIFGEFFYRWDVFKLAIWREIGRPILRKVVVPLERWIGGRFPRR